ncbi:MAG TPA: tetratricopeptide repeat protein [Bryobacteraceae bacterium]|nr:tetratricopeptide repeat protein [Bryobacteraceae bacterium]
MVRFIVVVSLMALNAPAADYELDGRIVPETQASVALHGASTPFESATLSDPHGRFRFRKLAQGTYTVAVFEPQRGEARQTVEVSPSVADSKRHVKVTLHLDGNRFESGSARDLGVTVSARELSVPDKARREFSEAQKKLSRPDVAGAVAHLRRAVEIAPQFWAAWNQLGTIAYQQHQYTEAADDFRKALAADSHAFEPLVNLGGVLLNLGKDSEALQYNLFAVLQRPNDALANSQLGMSYFAIGNLELAEKYLTISKRLDPAHFSHPQLLLAEIHLRRGENAAAVAELKDFLEWHPDDREAPHVRQLIAQLQK